MSVSDDLNVRLIYLASSLERGLFSFEGRVFRDYCPQVREALNSIAEHPEMQVGELQQIVASMRDLLDDLNTGRSSGASENCEGADSDVAAKMREAFGVRMHDTLTELHMALTAHLDNTDHKARFSSLADILRVMHYQLHFSTSERDGQTNPTDSDDSQQ